MKQLNANISYPTAFRCELTIKKGIPKRCPFSENANVEYCKCEPLYLQIPENQLFFIHLTDIPVKYCDIPRKIPLLSKDNFLIPALCCAPASEAVQN